MTPGTRWNYWLERVKAPLVNARDRRRLAARGDGDGWPVGELPDPQPFFIVGFPRSGSTLLRGILSQHDDVCIPPENGGLGRMVGEFARHPTAPWPQVVHRVVEAFKGGYESAHWELDLAALEDAASALPPERRTLVHALDLLYRSYARREAPDSTRWGDKTMPADCTYLYKIGLTFPRATYIHIIRDGRDAVASAMRQKMFRDDVAEAAWNWKHTMAQWHTFRRDFGGSARLHEIRYEKLVSDTETEISALCELLNLRPQPEMMRFQGAGKLRDVTAIAHHESVLGPVHTDSVGRADRQFSSDQQRGLQRIFGRELRALGYAA